MSQIGQRARRLRLDRDETMEDVARRAGLPYTTYWRIETGANDPTLKSLIRIAEALQVTLDDLAGDDDDDDTEPVAS